MWKLAEKIDSHVHCIVSGLIADSQKLIEIGRSEAHYHRFVYHEAMPIKAISQAVADLALNFGEGDITSKKKPIARPYGVSLLFGGVDATGPTMFHTDPSGTMVGYLAKGLGSAEEGIQSLLDKFYKPEMTLPECEKLAVGILKQVMEEKINKELVDVFVIPATTRQYVTRSRDEIEALIQAAPELL